VKIEKRKAFPMSEPKIAGTRSIKLELEPGAYWWCACGRSQSQPWCDGSHKGTEFKPLKYEVAETQRCSLCACKRTQHPPLCDHAHRLLPGYVPKTENL